MSYKILYLRFLFLKLIFGYVYLRFLFHFYSVDQNFQNFVKQRPATTHLYFGLDFNRNVNSISPK